MTSNINRGHGHIWQRPDGVKARCGGPGLCMVCQRERVILEAALATQPAEKADGERSGASLEAVAAAEINEAYWFRKTNAEAVAAILEHHEQILAAMEAKWRSTSELREELAAEPANGTTSDRYRAELYDEVWEKARDMGYGNVTMALAALELLKAAPPAAGVPEYRCHKCGSVTQPPAPYEVSVKCSCGVRTAATAALATAPTPPASEQQQDGKMPSDSRNRIWGLIDVALASVVPDALQRGDICNTLASLLASEHQQAVVLPERRVILDPSDKYCCKEIECEAWNDALDAVLRLNPHLAGVNQGVTTEAGNGEVGDAGE